MENEKKSSNLGSTVQIFVYNSVLTGLEFNCRAMEFLYPWHWNINFAIWKNHPRVDCFRVTSPRNDNPECRTSYLRSKRETLNWTYQTEIILINCKRQSANFLHFRLLTLSVCTQTYIISLCHPETIYDGRSRLTACTDKDYDIRKQCTIRWQDDQVLGLYLENSCFWQCFSWLVLSNADLKLVAIPPDLKDLLPKQLRLRAIIRSCLRTSGPLLLSRIQQRLVLSLCNMESEFVRENGNEASLEWN